MISYYRTFIPHFSKRCALLYNLTHDDVDFKWTQNEELILTDIKNYLSTEPILHHPNFSYPFILRTDASIEGLGAILSQTIDGTERIILYISRTVQPNEKNWSIQQLEALGIIWACETVRPFIIGTKVLIITDHKSLQGLKESKIPRLVRWACRLEEFDYEIIYQPGKFNTVADALSRLPSLEISDTNNRKYPSIEIGHNLVSEELTELNMLSQFHVDGITPDEIQIQQTNDQTIKTIRSNLARRDRHTIFSYVLKDNVLYRKSGNLKLLVVPETVKRKVLDQYHSHELGCHMARDRLYNILRTRFYWKNMVSDITEFINSCDLCLKIKSRVNLRHGKLRPIRVGKPFELVGITLFYGSNIDVH